MSPPQQPNPPPTPAPAPAPTVSWTLVALTAVITAGVIIGGGAFGLWWFFHPAAPQPEPIVVSVDANTPPHVGRIIEVHAETKGGLVKWLMLTAPSDRYDIRYSGANNHDLYFATATAGDYRLQAITVVGGEADVAEIHVLVDSGPTPQPPGPGPIPPGPNPAPIPAGQLRVLMTFDEDTYQSDASAQKVLNDTSIRKYIRSKGDYRIFSNKVQFGDEKPEWVTAFKGQKALGITIFNGQDGKVAYEGPLPKTVAEAIKLLQTYGGQ